MLVLFFLFTATAPTDIYTLSLHDALPIYPHVSASTVWVSPAFRVRTARRRGGGGKECEARHERDRKSTRLNSSHRCISYAVFCLKKKTATTPSSRSGRGGR